MPLDHYVSQVHLKNFYSPALAERNLTQVCRSFLTVSAIPFCPTLPCCPENGSERHYVERLDRSAYTKAREGRGCDRAARARGRNRRE